MNIILKKNFLLITPEKIRQFFEGNLKMLGDRFNLLPKHIREQVTWRSIICQDCLSQGVCKVCGCSVPGKLYVEKSCNDGERFPDLMDESDWQEYKKENNINLKMNKYTAILSGKAIEAFFFSLSKEDYSHLKGIELGNLSFEQISYDFEIGNREDASFIMTGVIKDELQINVFNEDDELIYQSDGSDFYKELYPTIPTDEFFLVTQNIIEGDILKFEFWSDEFNEDDLVLSLTSVGDDFVVNCIKWKDEFLEIFTDYLDYQFIREENFII